MEHIFFSVGRDNLEGNVRQEEYTVRRVAFMDWSLDECEAIRNHCIPWSYIEDGITVREKWTEDLPAITRLWLELGSGEGYIHDEERISSSIALELKSLSEKEWECACLDISVYIVTCGICACACLCVCASVRVGRANRPQLSSKTRIPTHREYCAMETPTHDPPRLMLPVVFGWRTVVKSG